MTESNTESITAAVSISDPRCVQRARNTSCSPAVTAEVWRGQSSGEVILICVINPPLFCPSLIHKSQQLFAHIHQLSSTVVLSPFSDPAAKLYLAAVPPLPQGSEPRKPPDSI